MASSPRRPGIRLLFAGDVMLGRLVNDVLRVKPPEYPGGGTLGVFARTDLRICNLQCVLSDRSESWTATPKLFHFRSDTRNVAVLRSAGLDAVSLANNHTLDCSYDTLADTLALLDGAGIRHEGAGRTSEEAEQAALIELDEGTVALLAFTDNASEWEATPRRLGVCYVPIDLHDRRAGCLLDRVRHLNATTEVVIVSAHWGSNWGYQPPLEHLRFARALIDAGADVVFGPSAHVCHGVELLRERAILYGAGNFIDDYALRGRSRRPQR